MDVEVRASLTYNGISVYLETRMNPGANHSEEVVITLASGDKITQNQFTHQHDSNGVFIEKADGTVVDFKESQDKRTSYLYQIEHCNKVGNK